MYYRLTEKYNWYIQNNEYWVDNETLFLNIKGSVFEIKFSEINEIFMKKINCIGLCHVVFEIKYGDKRLDLVSIPICKEMEPCDTELMDIFKILRVNSKSLKVVKDLSGDAIDYWLKA